MFSATSNISPYARLLVGGFQLPIFGGLSWVVYVGFVVDKMVLYAIFLELFYFPLLTPKKQGYCNTNYNFLI
jgi:hypothetical protein